MGEKYDQLNVEERCSIAVGLAQGLSMRAIARMLNRPHCTIVREINRNEGAVVYAPHNAQARCQRRKVHPKKKLAEKTDLWIEVQTMMSKGWSPEQVAGKLKPTAKNPG